LQLRRIGAAIAAVTVMVAPLASSAASAGPRRSRGQEAVYTPRLLDKRLARRAQQADTNRTTAYRTDKGRGTPAVGKRRLWPTIDDTDSSSDTGGAYFKKYKLRGISKHAEFWTGADSDEISRGLRYPDGDCRNDDPRRIKVTNGQVKYFLKAFEKKMYPRESRVFSVPPRRSGNLEKGALSNLIRPAFKVKVPKDYWKGKGRRIVILVDNVRDDNFYDTDNANTLSRIGGFYSRFFSELLDRHIMTIDSWNWLGNTTETPPHKPSQDPCLNFPANPFQYEGTFAHEYQHLLMSYADPDGETSWVNEGVADWAQTLTGYARPGEPITSAFYDSHIQCFLGYYEQSSEYNPIPGENCGPENSLTLWGDQTDNEIEILADYGAAYSMMELLVDRYGKDSMTYLHNDPVDGLDSLTGLLSREGSSASAADLVHEWLLMTVVDKMVEEGATVNGSTSDLEVASLSSSIDWDNDDDYMTPGAPPNGGDFVLARDASGQSLGADEIDEIAFDGSDVHPAKPVEWTVDQTGHDGDPALYSGQGDNFDRAIIDEVSVPASNATLTFDTKYNTEPLYDFAIVQVSTDDGETWTSLSNDNTSSDNDTGPPISDQLPGLNGNSGGGAEAEWTTESFDLSAYEGQNVLLSFRYMSDGGVSLPGWWIDNVQISGSTVSDGNDLGDWESRTEVNPVEVEGFTVQLVAWTDDGEQIYVGKLPLDSAHQGALSGQALDDVISSSAENLGIIVTYDESTESVPEYAPYVLQVNGATQPGGS